MSEKKFFLEPAKTADWDRKSVPQEPILHKILGVPSKGSHNIWQMRLLRYLLPIIPGSLTICLYSVSPNLAAAEHHSQSGLSCR